MNRKIFKTDLFYGFMCSLISFVFYIKTLMPGIGEWGDSARFQFFGKTLGTSYPTGYPLYILISNIFSRLPFGSLSYRINLMSAFFASATLLVLFLVINKLIKNKTLSLLSTLLFGFSGLFWRQSLIAEVYTLNTFLLITIVYTLMAWTENRQIKYLYLVSFIYGLSLGNHLTMTLILPAMVYLIIITDYRALFKGRNLAVIMFLFLLGISQYIYVFIRSQAFDSYIEMRIYTINEFLQIISGGGFREKMFSSSPALFFSEKLPAYIASLIGQFNIIGYTAGLAGLCIFLRDRLKYAVFLLLIIAANLFYALNYKIFDIDVYYIPTYMFFAVFIAVGLNSIGKLRNIKPGKRLSKGIAITLLLLTLGFNYSAVDQSRNNCMGLFADSILDNVEDNSVIIAPDFNWSQYYLYKLLGEKRRRGDNIFIMNLWRPVDYLTPCLSYTFKGGIPSISSTKTPAEKDELYAIFPYAPAPGSLRKLNVYLHTKHKEKLDKEGILSRKVLNLSCLGFEQALYKVTNKPSDRKIPEESLNLSPAPRKRFFKYLIYRLFGTFKISFRFKDRDFLRQGWARVEYTREGIPFCWALGKASSVRLPLERNEYSLTLRARPPMFKIPLQQTMEVYINNKYCSELKLDNGWSEYSLTLPRKHIIEGMNTINFKYRYNTTTDNMLDEPAPRRLAAAFEWIRFNRDSSH